VRELFMTGPPFLINCFTVDWSKTIVEQPCHEMA
jgi:hypothetical protein